uniref:CCHC-type domain-containing protein n=1 Tax=Tanacetum cinerariifolium TaxID=118510 RepID=A0A6L2LQ03_TANCI|nr:hypothetical protein [Tanacetum cinerariifolium]
MTPAVIEEMINRRVAKALEAYEANRNVGPVVEGDDEHGNGGGNGNGDSNGGDNGNGCVNGNRNGNRSGGTNRNGNGGGNVDRDVNERGVVPWNSHKWTVGTDAAFAKSWRELMELMTEMVPKEEDQVKRFIGGLPNNIQGNMIAVEPTRLQDAIRIANHLMDQKLKGYAVRSAENKRRLESNQRDNREQQPSFKRKNAGSQNVARAYTAGNNETRGYTRPLPYCNKCRLCNVWPCTVKYGKCHKVRHMARDYKATVAATSTQRDQVGNQRAVTCFECGVQGHIKRDCPKLKN